MCECARARIQTQIHIILLFFNRKNPSGECDYCSNVFIVLVAAVEAESKLGGVGEEGEGGGGGGSVSSLKTRPIGF